MGERNRGPGLCPVLRFSRGWTGRYQQFGPNNFGYWAIIVFKLFVLSFSVLCENRIISKIVQT
jgi:hypothetical protein